MPKRFHVKRLLIRQLDQTSWKGDFANKTNHGTEIGFEVIDGNLSRSNRWRFAVRVPNEKTFPIQVQPIDVPRRVLKGTARRVLTFKRGTMSGYKDKVYCPAAFEDLSGEHTKRRANRGERDKMPYWLRPLRHRMRLKPTVRCTKGTDKKGQVFVTRPHDYPAMIKIFMALRSWPLLAGRGLD